MRLPGNFPRFLKPARRSWWPLRVTARRRTLQQAAQRFHQVRVVINDQYVMAERVNEFRLHAFAPPLDLLSFLCNYNAQRAPGGRRIATKLKQDVRARDERGGLQQRGWSLVPVLAGIPCLMRDTRCTPWRSAMHRFLDSPARLALENMNQQAHEQGRNHEARATMGRQAGRSVRRPDWLELYQGGSCLSMLADVLADPHRAELGAAHATEGRGLEGLLGQRFVVHPAGGLGIEGETELVFPVEAVPRSAEGVVAVASPCPVARQVGRMRGDLVGDHALANVFNLGQAQVFLGCHVAKHAGAVPAGEGRTDGRGDVVIT